MFIQKYRVKRHNFWPVYFIIKAQTLFGFKNYNFTVRNLSAFCCCMIFESSIKVLDFEK